MSYYICINISDVPNDKFFMHKMEKNNSRVWIFFPNLAIVFSLVTTKNLNDNGMIVYTMTFLGLQVQVLEMV